VAYPEIPYSAALVWATITGERGAPMTAGVQRVSHRDTHERRSVLAGGCGHAARCGMLRGQPDEELAVNPSRAFAAQVIPAERGFQIVPTHFQSPAAHVSADPC